MGHILSVMVKGPGKSAGVHRHRQSQGLLDKPAPTTGFILPAKGDVYGSASARAFTSSIQMLFADQNCVTQTPAVSCTAEVHGTGAARGWYLVSGYWRGQAHTNLSKENRP